MEAPWFERYRMIILTTVQGSVDKEVPALSSRERTRSAFFIALLFATLLAALVMPVPAAAADHGTYTLAGIDEKGLSNAQNVPVRIDKIEHTANGGLIEFTEISPDTSGDCMGKTQHFRFTWVFDRDVSNLSGSTGDRLFTMRTTWSGDTGTKCVNQNPFVWIHGWGPFESPEFVNAGGENRVYFLPDPTAAAPTSPTFYMRNPYPLTGSFDITPLIPWLPTQGVITYNYQRQPDAPTVVTTVAQSTTVPVTTVIIPSQPATTKPTTMGITNKATTVPVTTRATVATTTSNVGNTGTTGRTACPASGMLLYVDPWKPSQGQTVEVPIWICNAEDLANMDLTVSYDPAVLTFVSARKGGLISSGFLFESNDVGGQVRISFAGTNGVSGSGTIAILTFKVAGGTGSSSTIGVTVTTASNSKGGKLNIPTESGTVTVTPPNPKNPEGRSCGPTALTALKALQMAVSKIPVDMTYDVVKDGTVNSADARELLRLATQEVCAS